MENVSVIKTSRWEAQKQHREYLVALKTQRQPYLRSLATASFHLKKGRGIVDIYQAFKQAGVNENFEPRLAIARADCKRVTFNKHRDRSGSFLSDGKDTSAFRISLPSGTFPAWPGWPEIINRNIETKVPIVPAHLLPRGPLSCYYVMWEAKDWEQVTTDPILLKRINNNLFAVFATWDLTPLERALINGR